MSDAIPVTYYWDASTPTEIAGALEVFSAKYPVLNAKNGKGIKLTFVKGKDPATCSLKAEKNEYGAADAGRNYFQRHSVQG